MATKYGSSSKAAAGAKRAFPDNEEESNGSKRMLFDIKKGESFLCPCHGPTNQWLVHTSPLNSIRCTCITQTAAGVAVSTLPHIHNAETEKLVFTHPSVAEYLTDTYNRLEWYGDSVIEMVATDLLWETYPGLPAGRLSQIRESLVNNMRLSTFSRAYGFDNNLLIDKKIWVNSTSGTRTKILGDVFEAYVGAIALEDRGTDEDRAGKWLRELWKPLLVDADRFELEDDKNQDDIKMRANSTFSPSGSGLHAWFEDMGMVMVNKAQQQFRVGYFLKGWGHEKLKLGEGVGQNKKTAKTRAAAEALNRAKTDHVLKEIKEKTDKYKAEKRAEKEEREKELALEKE